MQVQPKPPTYQAEQFVGGNRAEFVSWFNTCWGLEFEDSLVLGTLKLLSPTGQPSQPLEVPTNHWVVFGPFDPITGVAGYSCWIGTDPDFLAIYEQV